MRGSEVRIRRELVGLRQIDVAKQLGLDNETIYRWEKTDRKLTKLQADAVVRLFGDHTLIAKIIREQITEHRRRINERRKKSGRRTGPLD